MMIKSIALGTCAVVLALSLPTSSAYANELLIASSNRIEVRDGSVASNRLNGTDYGQIKIGNQKLTQFWTDALDNTPIYRTGPVTVTGVNPSDFQVSFGFYLNADLSNGRYPLDVTFKPTGSGVRKAIITFPTNIPGPLSQYTFAVQGEGINGLPVATSDLDFIDLNKAPKSKPDKKSGQYKVDWTVYMANIGPVANESALVSFYQSNDSYFSIDDHFISFVSVKSLKAAVEGKKIKTVKVKIKALLTEPDGYLFAFATNYPSFPTELNQDNNSYNFGYYTLGN